MSKINWGRVVLGGVVFTVVIGIFFAVQVPIFAGVIRDALGALGASFPDTTPAFLASSALLNLAAGFVVIWLYAAIRPRYGPGPRTAAIAGFAIWFVVMLAMLDFAMLTALTVGQAVALHGPSILAFVASSMAGAWVYREASP